MKVKACTNCFELATVAQTDNPAIAGVPFLDEPDPHEFRLVWERQSARYNDVHQAIAELAVKAYDGELLDHLTRIGTSFMIRQRQAGQCNICHSGYQTYDVVLKPMNEEDEWYFVECQDCGYDSDNARDYRHESTVKDRVIVDEWFCPRCDHGVFRRRTDERLEPGAMATNDGKLYLG